MRVEPSEKVLKQKDAGYSQKRVEAITRIIAIIVAFLSTFFFFIKILFL